LLIGLLALLQAVENSPVCSLDSVRFSRQLNAQASGVVINAIVDSSHLIAALAVENRGFLGEMGSFSESFQRVFREFSESFQRVFREFSESFLSEASHFYGFS
jgi:hypothetical protein